MMLLNAQNNYEISGISVPDLIQKYDAPLYVYNTEVMERKYHELKHAFPKVNIKINYACKALSNINILSFFHGLGAGLDTVSIEEVQLGLQAGYAPQDIMFTPNCVSFAEMKMAVGLGVKINIDNISILEQFGHAYGNTYPVCIRINPHIMAGGNVKISTGHIDSKFGISVHQMRHVERIIQSHDMRVEGLHMHTGSDILDVDVFLRGAELLLESALQFPDLKYIDFGSGFKVSYKPNDYTTDIQQLGEKMSERFLAFCNEYGSALELHFEPGKYLVSEAGTFLVQVNVIKQTTATIFAGVDSGLNHLIRPMFYDAYHHILNVSNPGGTPRLYTVVGYICETDTFAWDRKIEEIKEGDILAFQNAGAYCFSMASNYNSRLRPAEVMIHKGKDYLIRRRETFEDLTRQQVLTFDWLEA